MKSTDKFFQEVAWNEVKESFKKVDPGLFQIIEEWGPSPDYKLYRVAYRYGDPIIEKGLFHVPGDNGQVLPLNAGRFSQTVKDDLSYSHVPLGLLTKNGQEVFIENAERVISIAFFKPGILLGLWEALKSDRTFSTRGVLNVSAGARSLFLLPKVAEAGSYERLRKFYGVRLPMPRKLMDHGPIFAQLAKHRDFHEEWRHEIVFFSKKWLERDESNMHWLKFHHYLLEKAWNLSSYNRNTLAFSWIWQQFAESLTEKGLKPNTYLMDTLKQLVLVGVGAVPGFRPTHQSWRGFSTENDVNIAGPVEGLQRIYLEDYGLKNYVPSMMMPHHFSKDDDCRSVYYSLQVPTLLDSVPKARSQQSLMTELRDLKTLVQHFLDDALEGLLKIEGTPVEWLVKNVAFDFFHSDQDGYDEILSSTLLSQEDPSFLKYYEQDKNRTFPDTCAFVRGCVRLKKI
jgi:hypothetical protein